MSLPNLSLTMSQRRSDLDDMALRSFGGSPGRRYVRPDTPVEAGVMTAAEVDDTIDALGGTPPLSFTEHAEARRTIAAWFDLPPEAVGPRTSGVKDLSLRRRVR